MINLNDLNKTIDNVTPMNNTCIIRSVADSVEDFRRGKLLKVVRNSANSLREIGLGEIINLPKETYVSCGSERLPVELKLGDIISYDLHSRLSEFLYNNETYYLIRIPDIIGIMEGVDLNEKSKN